MNNTEKNTVCHEVIKLIGGRELKCFPLSEPKAIVDNTLSLDTTGVYFSISRKKPAKKTVNNAQQDPEKQALKQLFLDNAFLFFANKERILSDSRMFLCPIPIQSGLAYFGINGFKQPTLGIYIEFWSMVTTSTQTDENGEKWLLYHIAGSPLSGSNRCGFVNKQGKTKIDTVLPFTDVWHPFKEINTHYDEAKSKYEAYTLQQVLAILKNEEINLINE